MHTAHRQISATPRRKLLIPNLCRRGYTVVVLLGLGPRQSAVGERATDAWTGTGAVWFTYFCQCIIGLSTVICFAADAMDSICQLELPIYSRHVKRVFPQDLCPPLSGTMPRLVHVRAPSSQRRTCDHQGVRIIGRRRDVEMIENDGEDVL
ncbi:hypothetical protein OF83DRAFT_676683 [Amylostereum chailletii]|nr:hypothetical protein OF83DRAFT_676683 [Amylostereum chailletii]